MRQNRSRTVLAKTVSPVDRAYNYILEAIIAEELTPGMHVPSESVAEALGISRMPVRDALRRLEGDGVVTIFANRGAVVAEYSHDEIVELIEMRATLEGLAARIAIERVGPSEIEELEYLRARMERAAGDLVKWMACHDDFHNYLTSLSSRPLLMQQCERMRLMLRPYFRRYYAESHELEIVGLEHQAIIDAIVRRDPDALERTVRSHATANTESVAAFAGGTEAGSRAAETA